MIISDKLIARHRGAANLAVRLLFFAFSLTTLQATVAFSQSEPTEEDFQRTVVADGLDLPMEFEISEDGRVFIASKCGGIYAWDLDSGSAQQTSVVPNVRCEWEDGLLSVALDPDFVQNGYIYFQYTAPGSLTRVSRYTVNADNSLDMESESILLEWQTGNEAHGHMGGSIHFDPEGNLLISTGDNMAAGGYYTDSAQASSGNTNDLRGKILRITPTADGDYTIPEGNLFEGDELRRPEIYGMGFRNPFRLNIDPETGYVYVGDIGPDASTASEEGPMGMDEITELSEAGNYGWPWVVGFNEPYAGFDPNNLVNNYSENTGATDIPDAKPALWTILHRAIMAGPVYRIDESIDNDTKLPAYYNGKLIFWDFNSSNFFTLDVSSGESQPEAVDFPIDTSGFQGAIDVELDPRTHELYVLQWGAGCCSKEPYGGGALYRFEYVGDREKGVNLSVGALATATSEAAGNLASHAIDGDPVTRWESEPSDPQTLNVDLQSESVIGSIGLSWEAAYSSAYRIEASQDGESWDVLVDASDGSGGTRMHVIESQTPYRYVRYIGLARGTDYGHSLFEFEIFAGEEFEPPEELTEFAYLDMPRTLDGEFTDVPQLLSQTGAFSDTANMVPSENMIPFEPNTQLWSDRAEKERWISIPAETQVDWHETEDWSYPQGTVAVKHFDLPLDANDPGETKRLETRLLVVQENGRVYGVTYKWNDQQTDAELLTDSVTEDIDITDADGNVWTQTWAYPSPTECIDCHTAESSQLLGLSTRQLNGEFTYPGGDTENQLAHWNDHDLFSPGFNNEQIDEFDQMAAITDDSATLEHRIKSYLDTNCAHCHGTDNGGSQWDARFNTPLNEMRIVDEQTTGIRNYMNYYGIEDAEVVSSGAPHESILYIRDKSVDPDDRMPPLARALEHTEYIDVLEQWIDSLGSSPDPDPGTDELLSSGAPASSSSVEGDYVASQATDGDPDTRWSSEAEDPQSITIDLEEIHSISRIVLNWEAAYASAYVIEGSVDGNNWEEVLTQSNGTGGVETHENLSGTYRYIRLTGTERGTPWGYSLWEFEVFGSADVPEPGVEVLSPASGQQYTDQQDVSLQVEISDANWLDSGGGYSYTLDDGAAVTVTDAGTVNLGTLTVGQHTLGVQLLDSDGEPVGDVSDVDFSVDSSGSGEPELLSLNRPVSTSDVEGDYVGANAVDGDLYTRWASEFADPQWIQIDLEDEYPVTEISLAWEAAYGSVYTIEGSTDADSWTTLISQNNGEGGLETYDDLSGTYRYIRLTGTERGTEWGYSLWEFEVWGGSDSQPSVPQIDIESPSVGETYLEGNAVPLEVAISETDWFAEGGSFQYVLDGNSAVEVDDADAVDLGTLSVGQHDLEVQLLSDSGQTVGSASNVSFVVDPDTSSDPVLLSENSSVTASDSEEGYGPENAVDGNEDSRWSSGFSDDQFIQIDLGASMSIDEVVLEWEAAYASGYIIEVSEDGSTWDEIYSTSNGDGGTDVLSVNGQGRYVRLTGTERATAYGYSLWEFQVFGTSSEPGTPSISIASPAAGEVYAADESVSLQVAVSDSGWFSDGGQYRYSLDGGDTIDVSDGDAIDLGALEAGDHTLSAQLVDAEGQPVGSASSVQFTVSEDAPNAQIELLAPATGQEYQEGESVELQVAVNDDAWFANGGGYRYTLDDAEAVQVDSADSVNLGSLSVGSHDIQVTLLDEQGQVVGDSRSANFQVEEVDGTTPPTPGPSQLTAVGATASSGNAANAIDGDTSSRWESEASDPQYIELDMGESTYFTGVSLDWEAAYASEYSIEVSEDGSSWETVYSTDSGHGGASEIALNGEQGRYIRMYGTERATTYGYSLWEFEVYGLPADPDLPLVSVDAPAEGEEIPEGQAVQLEVSLSDATWLANGGSYNYSLNNADAVNVSSTNSVDLGALPTGQHTLRVSLVNSDGVEVSVPRTLNFRVSCGDDCPNVLVFSKTSGFRHGSIPAGIAMVEAIGAENGYTVTASEDASLFTEDNLAQYSTIVFMNTTGDIFTDDQKAAFRAYIEGGGGYVGSHSAADTEHGWSWYTDTLLAGAEFVHHGDGIPYARVEIEQTDDHTVDHIGSEWFIADEWYFWESNPRSGDNVEVLAILDRTSYESNYADEDHPVIFKNTVGQGRVFYTALGHVDANYSDPNMVEKIREAIEWTSGD